MTDQKPRTLDYDKDVSPALEDGRLDAPAFHRNKDAIASVLIDAGGDGPADLLEIACGTGQHAAYIARMWPEVAWWPTDLMETHLKSTDAWVQYGRARNVRPATLLDVCSEVWTSSAAIAGLPEKFDIIFAANMIHIAPWQATLDLFKGTGQRLRQRGAVIIYGPFMRNGEHYAESNERFDESLRARNADWGVRDLTEVEQVAAEQGLFLREDIAMPAHNTCAVFRF